MASRGPAGRRARFSQVLRRRAAPLWRACLEHPFVRGIGRGTLPLEKFRYYMGQDYLFLIDYSRVLSLAAAKAPALEEMGRFAGLAHSTLTVEMQLHQGFARQVGISPEELEQTQASPATLAYTRHLLSVAYSGSLGQIAAAVLPCQWSYCEIGRRLAKEGEPRGQPLYAQWIRAYSSAEFAALADWLRGLVDRLGDVAREEERRQMEQAFLASSRYEHLFWEAAWRMQGWPA